jgi:hypothetical protein
MNQTACYKVVALLMLALLATPSAQASADSADRAITGDWLIKVDFGGWRRIQATAILSLFRDEEGELAGMWIDDFWGLSELSEVKYDRKQLSFARISRSGDREFRTDFRGWVTRGKLSGNLSGDAGEATVEGSRIRPMPEAVGTWEMKLKVGERRFAATLVVKADKDDKLTAEWQSDWGEHEITNVQFKDNRLTFKRNSKAQDRQWESTFEGTVKGNTLAGTVKSERAEISLEGKRVGAGLIGKWELQLASQHGGRRQILKVNPDLSAMYGPTAIEKVGLEGKQVSFQIVLEFGGPKFEMNFKGQLSGRKLTGAITSFRGTRKVTGRKLLPTTKKR